VGSVVFVGFYSGGIHLAAFGTVDGPAPKTKGAQRGLNRVVLCGGGRAKTFPGSPANDKLAVEI